MRCSASICKKTKPPALIKEAQEGETRPRISSK